MTRKKLIVMDIDDTLLRSKNIFIERKLPSDEQVVFLTTSEFAEENVTSETAKFYSFTQFNDEQKVYDSIVQGEAILDNLKVMDLFINNGFELAILTARSNHKAVCKALRHFLEYKNYATGQLETLDFNERYCYAVSDPSFAYLGTTTSERKSKILHQISKDNDVIVYLDDDGANIDAVNKMILKNVIALKVQG
jgi:hypothetical protein